ncbi:porin family protein [Halanaerobium saccharolyticum]|uniref:porin n=1 Tax=Halanaerobium saccharolyticum TaxID=43595 RepID=UPI001F16CCCD|nr:porin [Halanaerobium saccharolyticum]
MVILFSKPVLTADIGGKASLNSNLTYADSELNNSLAAELELEWYLPYDFPLDIQNRTVISLDEEAEDQVELWFKKLYLRQKLGPLTVKLGKQPVSWSYGALINPVDYSLGAENLEEESRAKYVNGIELYYPINWGSGLTFVASDIDGKEHKWALRGRTTYKGYDLSASYVQTPVADNADFERYGLTAKGDLGPLGVYGAYGLWRDSEIDYDIYQLGADYSYHFLAGSQLFLQGEYLRLEGAAGDISAFDFFNLGTENGAEQPAADSGSSSFENLDFFNTNISYELDEFSSIGIMTVSYLDDGSTIFIPNYSYLFGSNLLLELRGSIAAGKEDEVLGGEAKAVEINLSYTF